MTGIFPDDQPKGLSVKAFNRLAAFIEEQLGIRMPETKKIMLESRLNKRLRLHGYANYEEYLDFVFSNKNEGDELIHMIDAITTNKTDFFREPDHFELLTGRLLPQLLQRRPGRGLFSFWSAGCSTGEEPYTLAMVLAEFQAKQPGFDFHITASDISSQALQKAVNAVYASERVSMLSPAMKKKYLLRSRKAGRDEVRIKPELRQKVEFLRLNFMDQSYPFDGPFQVVFCRNVIIYFDRPTQEKILGRMCRYLQPGGIFLLGHSETLTGMDLPLHSLAPTVYERM
ncbi:MAG: chemotaxis protein CheR [Spirochaetes bacterium GWD1_61_31]|nr:MAG: chemotaxis protein CheR [Spirochaetes bacterium GWB1_60_80]OHD30575.1 MAG: chemotaxis protein CheR [Spirochaetes bacterium GWC1_61_12]OHD34843.1 MAG: chemotaxis protein CheR [Spirochaetes bacterium GWD1_61_31]OHD46689.1 MAG: chemotaxis protein CheR [Spirochaetes bacterium GWE1_60_18]OHD60318.1 MAG: chemotaxis protein CheR [Spirochaetes bacterium GWF1_60_12]